MMRHAGISTTMISMRRARKTGAASDRPGG
jgi:hypothetical protein